MEKSKFNGWLVLYKPIGCSSNQLLGKIKRIFSQKKAGFIGTLDPLAHGVLPVALGEATKLIPYIKDHTKEYDFTVEFGYSTDTLDQEGEVTARSSIIPKLKDIEAVLPKFSGVIKQEPPKYSAIKISGKRAYELARQGCDFVIASREVEIYSLKLINSETADNKFSFSVQCSQGTYVRSLARDIAETLGTLATITDIKRSRSGKFNLSHTIMLESLEKILHNSQLSKYVMPIDIVLDDIPVINITEAVWHKIKCGQKIHLADDMIDNVNLIMLKFQDRLCALGKCENGVFKPERVFNNLI